MLQRQESVNDNLQALSSEINTSLVERLIAADEQARKVRRAAVSLQRLEGLWSDWQAQESQLRSSLSSLHNVDFSLAAFDAPSSAFSKVPAPAAPKAPASALTGARIISDKRLDQLCEQLFRFASTTDHQIFEASLQQFESITQSSASVRTVSAGAKARFLQRLFLFLLNTVLNRLLTATSPLQAADAIHSVLRRRLRLLHQHMTESKSLQDNSQDGSERSSWRSLSPMKSELDLKEAVVSMWKLRLRLAVAVSKTEPTANEGSRGAAEAARLSQLKSLHAVLESAPFLRLPETSTITDARQPSEHAGAEVAEKEHDICTLLSRLRVAVVDVALSLTLPAHPRNPKSFPSGEAKEGKIGFLRAWQGLQMLQSPRFWSLTENEQSSHMESIGLALSHWTSPYVAMSHHISSGHAQPQSTNASAVPSLPSMPAWPLLRDSTLYFLRVARAARLNSRLLLETPLANIERFVFQRTYDAFALFFHDFAAQMIEASNSSLAKSSLAKSSRVEAPADSIPDADSPSSFGSPQKIDLTASASRINAQVRQLGRQQRSLALWLDEIFSTWNDLHTLAIQSGNAFCCLAIKSILSRTFFAAVATLLLIVTSGLPRQPLFSPSTTPLPTALRPPLVVDGAAANGFTTGAANGTVNVRAPAGDGYPVVRQVVQDMLRAVGSILVPCMRDGLALLNGQLDERCRAQGAVSSQGAIDLSDPRDVRDLTDFKDPGGVFPAEKCQVLSFQLLNYYLSARNIDLPELDF